MKTKKYFPGIIGAVILCFILVVIQMFLSVAFQIIIMFTGSNAFIEFLKIFLPVIITFFIILFIAIKKCQGSVQDIFKLNKVPAEFWFSSVILVTGLLIVNSEFSNFLIYFFPMPDFIANLFNEMLVEYNIFVSLLLVAVLPAITEELIFRGALLNGLSRNYSKKKGIVISAILFAIVHLNPWQFVPAFVLGIFLAWICLETQSIYLCMFIHFINNAISVIISRVNVPINGLKVNGTGVVEFQPVWFDIMGIVLTGAGILVTIKLLGKYKKKMTISNPGDDIEI